MRLRGRYRIAREQLLLCAQSGCPALISNDCIAQLSDVNASLPTVVFAVGDERGQDLIDVRVLANGALLSERLDGRAIPVDPGVYELRFEADGFQPATQKVTVLEAQKQRLIRVQLTPARGAQDAPSEGQAASSSLQRRYLASYALWGGALAALATGVGVGVAGKRELDRLDKRCAAEPCDAADLGHGKHLYVGADVAFGLSAGFALSATWLFFATRRSARSTEALALCPLRMTLDKGRALMGYRAQF